MCPQSRRLTSECSDEISDIEGYRGGIVLFEDMLDSNQEAINTFFTRGRNEDLDVFFPISFRITEKSIKK